MNKNMELSIGKCSSSSYTEIETHKYRNDASLDKELKPEFIEKMRSIKNEEHILIENIDDIF